MNTMNVHAFGIGWVIGKLRNKSSMIMGEMKMTNVTNVITLKQYAELHELDVKRLRRLARKNEWPTDDNAPFKFGTVWAIDANAPAITLPAKSARGARRADGRQRHIVFCNATEHAAIVAVVGGDNVIDPRVKSKIRRDARKLNGANDAKSAAVIDGMFTGDIVLHGVPMRELPDGTLVVDNDDNE